MDVFRSGKILGYLKIASWWYILYTSLLYFSEHWQISQYTWVDLTHSFSKDTVYYPGMTNFTLDILYRGEKAGYWYETNRIALGEHGGTHCDAPVHFAKGKMKMHEIPVESFHGDAVVIDISRKAKSDLDARLDLSDITKFEQVHGKITKGAMLFMYSGWDRHWPNEEMVLGNKDNSSELHFPGLHPDLVVWLVRYRNLTAVGVDTPSVDFGQTSNMMVHRILSKHNIYGMENVNNLGRLPPVGSQVYVFPMKIQDGSGGPCRIVAKVPETQIDYITILPYLIVFIVCVL